MKPSLFKNLPNDAKLQKENFTPSLVQKNEVMISASRVLKERRQLVTINFQFLFFHMLLDMKLQNKCDTSEVLAS